MTARTKKGYSGHKTHGADHGTTHERLMHAHTTGSRPAGAPAGMEAPQAPPEAPEMPAMSMAPPGADAEPASDPDDGDQT